MSGKIPADYSAEGKSPRWQIVLTTEGGTVRTIAAYPLDTFSDALMVDGVIRYYVHIEALDSVLDHAADMARLIVSGRMDEAMNGYNGK